MEMERSLGEMQDEIVGNKGVSAERNQKEEKWSLEKFKQSPKLESFGPAEEGIVFQAPSGSLGHAVS